MIITKVFAQKLIDQGHAEIVGKCYDEQLDKTYAIVNNLIKKRTDHYFIGSGDLRD